MEDWLNSLRVASGQINLAGYAVSQALVVLLLTSLLVSNYISAQPARRLYQASFAEWSCAAQKFHPAPI